MSNASKAPTLGADGHFHFELYTGRTIALKRPTMKTFRTCLQLAPEIGKSGADNLALKEELFLSLCVQDGGKSVTRDDLVTAGGLNGFDFYDAQEVLEAVGKVLNPPKREEEGESE